MLIRPKFHKILSEKVLFNGTHQFSLAYNAKMFEQASCAGLDTDLFYPVEERDNPSYLLKRVCGGCPIKNECLEWGLVHERFGTWGGASAFRRKQIRKERGWTLNEFGLPSPRQ